MLGKKKAAPIPTSDKEKTKKEKLKKEKGANGFHSLGIQLISGFMVTVLLMVIMGIFIYNSISERLIDNYRLIILCPCFLPPIQRIVIPE